MESNNSNNKDINLNNKINTLNSFESLKKNILENQEKRTKKVIEFEK